MQTSEDSVLPRRSEPEGNLDGLLARRLTTHAKASHHSNSGEDSDSR
jgi:hypothetical protein